MRRASAAVRGACACFSGFFLAELTCLSAPAFASAGEATVCALFETCFACTGCVCSSSDSGATSSSSDARFARACAGAACSSFDACFVRAGAGSSSDACFPRAAADCSSSDVCFACAGAASSSSAACFAWVECRVGFARFESVCVDAAVDAGSAATASPASANARVAPHKPPHEASQSSKRAAAVYFMPTPRVSRASQETLLWCFRTTARSIGASAWVLRACCLHMPYATKADALRPRSGSKLLREIRANRMRVVHERTAAHDHARTRELTARDCTDCGSGPRA